MISFNVATVYGCLGAEVGNDVEQSKTDLLFADGLNEAGVLCSADIWLLLSMTLTQRLPISEASCLLT